MLDTEASLARLHAGYESVEVEKARAILEDWRQIDEATIQTGLIPRYQEVFRVANLDPYFVVRSFGEVQGLWTIKTRAVCAVDEDRLDVMPGFVIDQTHWTPRHPISLHLVDNIDQEWVESAKATQARINRGEELPVNFMEISPIPYWWPKEYGESVGDVSDYDRDIYGWEAAFRRELPNNPFRDGMEHSKRVFGKPEEFMSAWQNQADMINGYFESISQALLATSK